MFYDLKFKVLLYGILFFGCSISAAQKQHVVQIVNNKRAAYTIVIPSTGVELREIEQIIPPKFRNGVPNEEPLNVKQNSRNDGTHSIRLYNLDRMDESLSSISIPMEQAFATSSASQRAGLNRLMLSIAQLNKDANDKKIDHENADLALKQLLADSKKLLDSATSNNNKSLINKAIREIEKLLLKPKESKPGNKTATRESFNLISVEKRIGANKIRIYFPFSLLDSILGSYELNNGDLIRITSVDNSIWSDGFLMQRKVENRGEIENEFNQRGFVRIGRLKEPGKAALKIDQGEASIKFDKVEIDFGSISQTGDVFMRIVRRVDYVIENENVIHVIYIPYFNLPRTSQQGGNLSAEKKWFNNQTILGGDTIAGILWSDDKILRKLYVKNELIKQGKLENKLVSESAVTKLSPPSNSFLSHATQGKLPKLKLPRKFNLSTPINGLQNLEIKGPNFRFPF